MLLAKLNFKKKILDKPYFFLNSIFAFFPISFMLGSLLVNLNLILFCGLGAIYLKSKILKNGFDFSLKIIFLFFFIIFLSSAFSLVQAIYFDNYDSYNLTKLSDNGKIIITANLNIYNKF